MRIFFCFGRSPGRTQDPERRTPSKHPSSILLTTRFENFASSKRDRSLYSTRASDSLNLPLPTLGEGVLETNANPLRPDETAGVSFDRYPKKNRTGYIYILYDRLDPERLIMNRRNLACARVYDRKSAETAGRYPNSATTDASATIDAPRHEPGFHSQRRLTDRGFRARAPRPFSRP